MEDEKGASTDEKGNPPYIDRRTYWKLPKIYKTNYFRNLAIKKSRSLEQKRFQSDLINFTKLFSDDW
jgi:hypothetical protein